ncbi:MAG: hypothetical protein L0H38_01435, partial [bacterium]|nr:hypothetical protein [bacterium]
MLGLKRKFSRGDTIIEVLFAVTVFSMVAVGGLSIMNQGISTAQRSLELALVRQQMDGQAETLRFLHRVYVASYGQDGASANPQVQVWNQIKDRLATTPGQFDNADQTCQIPSSTGTQHPFALNTRNASIIDQSPVQAGTYARIVYPDDGDYVDGKEVESGISTVTPEGIWIEAIRGGSSSAADHPFIDFHIRTCWASPGGDHPVTLG